MTKRLLPYYIVDVFAEQRYAGNQLAVFVKPDGLSDVEMQQIAHEINYAETTFVLSDKQNDGGYQVRIFTPAEEVPFAGHPTLGTAFVIREIMEQSQAKTIKLNLKVGQIPVNIEDPNLWMRQINPSYGNHLIVETMADVLGLGLEDFDERFPIEAVSTGLPFYIVPLKNLAAVKKAKVDRPKWLKVLAQNPQSAKMMLVFSPETYHLENDLNCRMFGEELGVIEDAATGSANGCFLAWLLKHNYFNKTELALRIEQGYEMNRPSLLLHKGKKINDQEFEINIGGQVQLVAEGKWY